ncbi:MAG: lipopolysaccharide biosynthesis protein [Anaerolineales bacterium]
MQVSKRFVLYILPALVSTVLALATLPLTTYLLDPADFGLLALAWSVVSIGTLVSQVGAGFLLAAHFPLVDMHEKREMLSTLTFVSMGVVLAFCLAILAFWPWIISWLDELLLLPQGGLALLLLSLVFLGPWGIASQILIIDRRARPFAYYSIGESVSRTVAVLVSLYVFDLGVLALFVASAAGQAVLFLGAIMVLGPYLRPVVSVKWLKEITRLGSVTSIGNFVEQAQRSLESVLLGSFSGLSSLGLYAHSLRYREVTMMAMRAFGYSIWPDTLEEARELESDFPKTKLGWWSIQILVILFGLFFATLGKQLIALLTHDKFTDAYVLVALSTIMVLIKTAGRPALGILFTLKQATILTILTFVMLFVSLPILLLTVPSIGALGVILSLVVQFAIHRIAVQLYAARFHKIPFQDVWVIYGSVLVAITAGISGLLDLDLLQNSLLFTVMSGLLVLVARSTVVGLIAHGWEFLKSLRTLGAGITLVQ